MSKRKAWIPHPYQTLGGKVIRSNEATGLFWRPGSGKTVTALTAADDLLMSGEFGDRVLVVAPLRVALDTWVREADKWSHTGHLRVVPVLGPAKARLAALQQEADIFVINVENLAWLVTHYGTNWPFEVVIIDEYSGFKDHASQRVKKLKTVRGKIKRLVGLTGSPASNGYDSLYSLVGLLDGGKRLGRTLTQFRELWMQPDARSRTQIFSWKLRAGKKEEIEDTIRDICMSVPDRDLPPVTYVTVPTVLLPEEQKNYQTMVDDSFLLLRGQTITAANAAVLMGKLQQLTAGAIYAEDKTVVRVHEAKLDALKHIVAETEGPVLVFYGYRHELDVIQQVSKGVNLLGSAADIAKWNRGESKVAALHPGSAYGLNLQDGGCTIVWTTPPWSLEQYEQANARLHRQGQTKPVTIHHLVVPDSVDEQVLAALEGKDLSQKALLAALQRVSSTNV